MPWEIAAPLIGGAANALFGGHGGSTKAQLPGDLQNMRQQQIGLLQYLTGFGANPQQAGWRSPQNQQVNDWLHRHNLGGAKPTTPGQSPSPPSSPVGSGAPPAGLAGLLPFLQAGAHVRPMMASGGVVHGPGGPVDDQVPVQLSNGEGVLSAAAVHALGGPSIIHLLNAYGQAQAPHLAQGGTVGWGQWNNPAQPPPVLQGAMPTGTTPNMTPGPGTSAPAKPAVPTTAPGMGPMGQPNNTGQPKSDVQNRFETIYGPLGIPTTPLQQQSVGGMQQFLASNPYQQAQTALNGILGNPGQAFRPDFERSLAQANQTGGRFGSANAILRSNALNDYNSAALKQQLGAAQGIQGLGAQQSADLTSGYNMGSAQANQQASGQQQAIALLNQALGQAQSATLGGPQQTQPSGFQNFLQGAGGISQLLPFLQPQQQNPAYTANNANINPYYQGPGFGGQR